MDFEEYLFSVFNDIERKVSSGILLNVLPDSTSFLKRITIQGFKSRIDYFKFIAHEIGGKMGANMDASFLKTLNILDLTDIIPPSIVNTNPDVVITEKEEEEAKLYLNAYSNIVVMQIVKMLNSSQMDDYGANILQDGMNLMSRLNDEAKLLDGEASILPEDALKYFMSNANKAIINKTTTPLQPPEKIEKKITENKIPSLFPHYKMESFDLLAKLLEEARAIDSADKFKISFSSVKQVAGVCVLWRWRVIECFYLLHRIYDSEYYNAERIDSIALKIFDFEPSRTRIQLSSNYKKYSDRLKDKNTFDDYIQKKHKKVFEILKQTSI
ncbi:MAG TPA: hypothetical protein VN698_13075 [Bacteroidia bacterium]|nr:hypothetical protein [Bacteroidia bacterium]